jgi:hypothetical protein
MKSVVFCRVPGERNVRNRGRNGSWVGVGGHTGILFVSRCVDVEVRSVGRDLVAVVRSKFRYWGFGAGRARRSGDEIFGSYGNSYLQLRLTQRCMHFIVQ